RGRAGRGCDAGDRARQALGGLGRARRLRINRAGRLRWTRCSGLPCSRVPRDRRAEREQRRRTAMNAPVNIDPRAHAWSLPLDKLDLSDPQLYYDDAWQPYFERHRKEAPVNYIPDSPYGPYWSVAKYRDIVQVEVNHKVFSSS